MVNEMTTPDAHDIATYLMLSVKTLTKRYVPLLDLMGILKSADDYLISQDEEAVYIKFTFNKSKDKKI